MMLSVKGEFHNGVAQPLTEIEGREGQQVIITFLEETTATKNGSTQSDDDWDAMMKLIEDCQTNTGIGDLAHQHDHYLYGTPKRDD
ncbi:MAG: hypothetical protein AB7P14_26855 [Blastocatellales bacterium]